MKTIGNIIWLLFGGLWTAILWSVAGILCCITIIGIPFGIAAFRIASFTLWPFGRHVVPKPGAGGVLETLGNLLWLILIGWELLLAHLAAAVACAITIIGIPFALQHLKLGVLALWPFGREVVEMA